MGDIELKHSRKGSQRPNHKYYKREWRNGRWYYFYNKGEYVKNRISNNKADDDYLKEMKEHRKYVENDMVFDNMSPYTKEELLKEIDKNIENTGRRKERAARNLAREIERNRKKKKTNRKNPRNMTHSATGSTWQKKGAKYISRVRKNGKWVYIYAKNTANGVANKVTGVNPNYANTKSYDREKTFRLKGFPGHNKATVQEIANRNIRTTRAKNEALQKAARKRKLHAASVNVQRKVNKGKKKVAELLERLQKKYEDEKRRYAGKKAGRKSAKLSRERQKRLKQKNTIKLNKHQRVTFSDVEIN